MLESLPPGTDHFAVFGLPRRYETDIHMLETRFRELSWEVHPDRHAKGSPRERRIALERTTALNDAYRTLREPLKRAAYLLSLHGIKIESEAGRDSALSRLPPEFLEEVMELREGLLEARAEGDVAAVQRLSLTVHERREHALRAVEVALADLPERPEATRLEGAAAALARIRYYDRFFEEARSAS